MPLVQTRGAASAQGFGEFAQASAPIYIENVFSTYLYTGTGANRSITNGIDLSTKGGMVWIKSRSDAVSHDLFDTVRGTGRILQSNLTAAQVFTTDTQKTLTAFNTDGFSLGDDAGAWGANSSGYTFASWTFREQPKFFDVVTWTGTGATGAISHSHSLGSTPGFIVIKAVSTNEGAWYAYHRSLGVGQVLILNSTAASSSATSPDAWTVSSTQFSVNTSQLGANTNGTTYVAYLFAHDAGGFGLTGLDNVISCGSFTADGSGNATVSLGYEPQWVMMKRTDSTSNWFMLDVMRQMSITDSALLFPNLSSAESLNGNALLSPTATGFNIVASVSASSTWIYIAIRRGPMKVPTLGTSVFQPIARTGTGADATVTTGINSDLITSFQRTQSAGATMYFFDKLRGKSQGIRTGVTNAEASSTALQSLGNTSYSVNFSAIFNDSGLTYVNYSLVRAPGFFDEVCYTGTGSNRTVAHNLGVAPELMIFKVRSTTDSWQVYCSALDVSGGDYLLLNDTAAKQTNGSTRFTAAPTSTLINLATNGSVNGSGSTYVAYLFATCAGVSKVGSYTGTGTTQTINCGFTAGSRFIMIKRTDSTGAWYVWDSARGIVAGNDPYLLINSDAAEVTSTDYVDTANSGFEISSTAPAAINANGGSFIFLAIA